MDNSLYNPEWLKGSYHIAIVAYYFHQWDGFYMGFHSHNQCEIMYVVKGSCTVSTEDRSQKMKKGDFVLLDANVEHRLTVESDEPCRMLNIEFIFKDGSNASQSIQYLASNSESVASLLKINQPYIFLKDPDDIYPVLKSLILELGSSHQDKEIMSQLLITQLLIKISRLAEEIELPVVGTGSLHVRKAITYIQQHYDCDMKAEDIAAAVNIHIGHLHRVFKTFTGCTLLEYLTRMRLDRAKMLLANTDIPIIDISAYIGISSRQYFTYLFKKHTGITPNKFRTSSKCVSENLKQYIEC